MANRPGRLVSKGSGARPYPTQGLPEIVIAERGVCVGHTDQRGTLRPQAAACDKGSVEQ